MLSMTPRNYQLRQLVGRHSAIVQFGGIISDTIHVSLHGSLIRTVGLGQDYREQ